MIQVVHRLKVCFSEEVCQDFSTSRALIIEEDPDSLSLVHKYLHVLLGVLVEPPYLAPGLVAIHYRILLQSGLLEHWDQSVKMFLAILQPVPQSSTEENDSEDSSPLTDLSDTLCNG